MQGHVGARFRSERRNEERTERESAGQHTHCARPNFTFVSLVLFTAEIRTGFCQEIFSLYFVVYTVCVATDRVRDRDRCRCL